MRLSLAKLEAELTAIADALDANVSAEQLLYERRLALWQEGRRRGLSPTALAHLSRVKAVTVRSTLSRSEA